MQGKPLPASLAAEGRMMRDALARDLADMPDVELVTAHDARIGPPPFGESLAIAASADPWEVWRTVAARADVCWPVAPESEGALRSMAGLCREACPLVVAATDSAIATATSKAKTAAALGGGGIETPPTWALDDAPADAAGPFVSKPDDGAGCEDTRFWPDRPPPGALPAGHVVQPFVPGEAASLSVFASGDEATVLAANRQRVAVEDGAFRFHGLDVAAFDRADPRFAAVVERIMTAIPGLNGFFGVDLVLRRERAVVIEINPRVTTAYAGLRRALGVNPARLLPIFGGVTPPSDAPSVVEVLV